MFVIQSNFTRPNSTVKLSFNVAKYNLGKARLERMQSAVSPFTVRDLRGGPLEICKAFWIFALLLVDLCVSSALFSESKLSFIVTNLAFVAWKVY